MKLKTNIKNARISDSINIKIIPKKYDEQLYVDKFDDSDKIAKFVKKQNYQNSLKKK